jgi:hypothetical protein
VNAPRLTDRNILLVRNRLPCRIVAPVSPVTSELSVREQPRQLSPPTYQPKRWLRIFFHSTYPEPSSGLQVTRRGVDDAQSG